MIRWLPLIIIATLVVFLTVILFTKPQREVHTDKSPMLGKVITLPELTSLRGEIPITLVSESEQPVVLNLFASWCVPCLAEHPLFSKLQAEGHTLFGIGWSDAQDNITQWLQEHGDPFNAVWLDPDGDTAVPLGLRGVPETYVLHKGRVLFHHAGVLTPHMVEEEIRPLLAPVEEETE